MTPSFKHPPTPPAIPVHSSYVEAEQREFDGSSGEPTWALKPNESVCSDCWIVRPCDCEVAA